MSKRTEYLGLDVCLTDSPRYSGAVLDLEVDVEDDGETIYINDIRIVHEKFDIKRCGVWLLEHLSTNAAIYDKLYELQAERNAAAADRELEHRHEAARAL